MILTKMSNKQKFMRWKKLWVLYVFSHIRVIAVVFSAGAIYKSVLRVITHNTGRENTHGHTQKQRTIHASPCTVS